MKNNFVTWDMLNCPPPELKCILEKLICEYQCAPNTSFTGSFAAGVLTLTVNGISTNIPLPDLDNQNLSLLGNALSISGGNTVDLTPFANVLETVTTITNTVAGHKIADYTNEVGTTTPINETVTALGTPTLGAGNILTIPFVNESGVTQTVIVDLSGLVTVDINIDNATYDAANNIITVTETDGTVHTINLSEFSIIATTNPDGSITVVQEGVTKFTIPKPEIVTSIVNTVAGHKIADFSDELGVLTSINETITTIVNNGNGTATFTNEAGVASTFPTGTVTAVDNGDGTYTLTLANGTVVTISDTSVSPLVLNPDATLTYTDETGVATTFTLGDTITDNSDGTYNATKPDGTIVIIKDVVSTMVDNGDGTYTYTDEAGAATMFLGGVPQTITTIAPSTNGFTYTNEAGAAVAVTYVINGTNLEILVGGTLVQTVPLTLNEIQINNAGSDFNLTDDSLTFLETNGDAATINFAKYNISETINPDGSIGIYQNGNLITTIPAPCCVLVNKIPLAVVVDPNIVQTTNLNSIVTDSAGNVFFIDGAGNAQKLTTDFSLTVNAGTTNLATDASLGTATVGNGGTIHFWSSDGSVLFGVVQGSAETNVQTNSTIIPFTASVPVGNDAGIASTTVQGAIDEVDGKVEVLEDRQRAWAKTGDLQSTNSEDVLVTDNILHEGRVNIGASEAETPFDNEYVLKIGDDALNIAHTRTYGIDVKQHSFDMDLSTNAYAVIGGFVRIVVNPLTGIDTLEPTQYGTYPPAAIVNKFATLDAALNWVNRCSHPTVFIRIEGTTIGTPLVISSTVFINNKSRVTFNSAAGKQYITITGQLAFYDSIVQANNIEWNINSIGGLSINNRASFYSSSNTFNLGNTVTPIYILDGIFNFDSGTNTINFSANNQVLFHVTGNDGGKVIFSNHLGVSDFVVNTGAFTGLQWSDIGVARSIETWFCSPTLIGIPSNVNMSGTVIYYGSSQALKQAVYDNNAYNYAQNLGTTKPLRFTDLNSASPDGAYTTRKQLFINELGEIIVG